MGTPDFASEVLRHVLDWCRETGHGEVVGVYSQPDRPCGRGRACKPTPVKVLALEEGLPVYQPENFKTPEAVEELRALDADVLLVAAYGLILPRAVLDSARHGAINVHASLLPKYRGAAPIQRALLEGNPATGVTIMQMAEGMDTGDMLLQRALAISYTDTAADLHDQLADMGGRMLCETLDMLRDGTLAPIPQDDALATYAPKLSKDEGLLDFSRPAEEVDRRARAMHPWPGAYFHLDMDDRDKPLRVSIQPGEIGDMRSDDSEPGQVLGVCGGRLEIACGDRVYRVARLTPRGKKSMDAEAFACGYLGRCQQARACS